MDNYETKEAATNKVRFSISQEGEIKFDADGLEDWQLTDAIAQVTTQARQQRQASQKIKEITLTTEFLMHCLALGFISFVALGMGMTLSRVVSGTVQSGSQQGVMQDAR